MTQTERCSRPTKVDIGSVKDHVEVHLGLEGSILAGTIQASAPKVEPSCEVESPDGPERVAAVLRNSRSGRWVRAVVANPAPFEDKSALNGTPIFFDCRRASGGRRKQWRAHGCAPHTR